MAPIDYVFADYFEPNQGQSGIEAKQLYYIVAEPLHVYQGILFNELAWQGFDVWAKFLPRLTCNNEGPTAGYGPAEGVLR